MPFQFRKESIEEDLNSNFPSQGQGNPPLYYSLSEVVVPTYSINQVAEGSSLPEILQTAWDFSTGSALQDSAGTTTVIQNTGFWRCTVNATAIVDSTPVTIRVQLNDGLGTKDIWVMRTAGTTSSIAAVEADDFVVFLRSGDSLQITTTSNDGRIAISYRQIADVNGNLVNPLGFSAA